MTPTGVSSSPRRMPDDTRLLSVLASLRERGALGETSLQDAVAHAAVFVAAVPDDAARLIDLGSGGGLPGLVLAVRCPWLSITLVDRRERRMDLLRLACVRLEIADRVEVVTADVIRLANVSEHRATYDVATARAFGTPLFTMSCATPFLRLGGVLIVSEPPSPATLAERWPADELDARGYQSVTSVDGRVRVFRRAPGAAGHVAQA